MKEKTNAQIAFDETITSVYAVLKPLGFKKKALNFYRVKNEIFELINIQKSVYNESESVHFTINVCVNAIIEGKNLPTMLHCRVRERIGSIKKSGDFWYAFEHIHDIFRRKQAYQSEKASVLADIEQYALPFLEQFTHQDDVEHFYS